MQPVKAQHWQREGFAMMGSSGCDDDATEVNMQRSVTLHIGIK